MSHHGAETDFKLTTLQRLERLGDQPVFDKKLRENAGEYPRCAAAPSAERGCKGKGLNPGKRTA